ncbi:hypothetical protein KXR87_06105 [Yokenella regensburgei]|uniref:hypothetical protein n=1 Tax=Yokenella regensburgei TaxID=158877 RepID=UPI003F17BCA3
MNILIFKELCTLKEKCKHHFIKSISIEVKNIDSNSKFYFSILITDTLKDDIAYDEIVIEISSRDGIIYHADLSDSSGYIYIEKNNIVNKHLLTDFVRRAEEQFANIQKILTK